MADPSKEPPRPFSLVQGGLFHRFQRLLHLVRDEPPDPAVRIWGSVVVTFLPLVVLAAIQDVLIGPRVTLPLLLDLTVYARFLIAVPLLLATERTIDGRLAMAVRQFRTSELVPAPALADLEAAIARLERARDSLVPESLLLVGAFVLGWVNNHAILGLPVSSWRAITPGIAAGTTLAGGWLDFVSQPFFNFLVYRWLWRIALWSMFLWRVSRLDLSLVPTHPDGAAGLGFLGGVHAVFGAFLAPVSATLAAKGVLWVQYGEGTLESFRNAGIAYIVIALAITLGPLLVFMPKLIVTKRRGLLEYSGLALEYTRRFDQKWLREARAADQPLLGSGDIQSLADMANSFSVVKTMRIVPSSTRNAVPLVLALTLPMVPFLAAIIPLQQILKLLLQLVTR